MSSSLSPGSVLRACTFALLFGASSHAQTWVVDAANGPGTNFTTITPAVAAAQPGDVIVVRPGLYSETVTVNKGVTIVAWNVTTYPMTIPTAPFGDSLSGGLLVTNIPVGQRCIVSGLVITRPSTSGGMSVGVVDCPGVVVLDRIAIPNGGLWISNSTDVFIESAWIRHQPGAIPPTTGVTVVNAWVQANDLDATGGDLGGEPNFFSAAAPALEVHADSLVALARPKLLGGFGGGPWITSLSTPDGGPAIRAVGSLVAIVDDVGSASYLVGGQGGHRGSASSPAIPSGNGGNGVEALSSGVIVNKLPIVIVPGQPGANDAGGPLGVGGAASFTATGGIYAPVMDVPAVLRSVSASTSGGFVILSHHAAAPGIPVAMAVMLAHSLYTYPPSSQFAGGLPSSAIILALGTANASGYFDFGFGLPLGIPITLAGTALIVQTADDVGNTLFLANPTTWVLGF